MKRPFMLPDTSQPKQALVAVAAGICVLLSGCEWLAPSRPDVIVDTGPRTVYALGHLEPATGIIDIRATPGDRLQELHSIVENELTPANGILGYLSSYSMGKAQLNALVKKRELAEQKHLQQVQLAEAQLAQANASKAQADAKLNELKLRQGKLEALKVASDLAASEYRELEQLLTTDPDLVTQHQLDKQKNQMDLARQDYIIARDTLISASEAADLAVVAAEANIKVATTVVEQASENFDKIIIEQEIEVAKEVLKRSVLLVPNAAPNLFEEEIEHKSANNNSSETPANATQGPVAYTVLKVFLRQGEVVTQTPIMQLGDLRKMICIAEVYEADVKELEEHQGVTIRSPAFWGDYADGAIDPTTQKRAGGIRGHVVRIGRLIAPPGLSNRNPLAPADRSVVEVRIEIDADDLKLAAREESARDGRAETPMEHAAKHVGLQVTVEFDEKTSANKSSTINGTSIGSEENKPLSSVGDSKL